MTQRAGQVRISCWASHESPEEGNLATDRLGCFLSPLLSPNSNTPSVSTEFPTTGLYSPWRWPGFLITFIHIMQASRCWNLQIQKLLLDQNPTYTHKISLAFHLQYVDWKMLPTSTHQSPQTCPYSNPCLVIVNVTFYGKRDFLCIILVLWMGYLESSWVTGVGW